MATFALVHGSGDGGWSWHLVQRALEARGHASVAPDLPTDLVDATWEDCVEAVLDALGDTDDVVVVGHSSGGFVVPLVVERLGPAVPQVFVAGMVPRPGETPEAWFAGVGWADAVAEAARRDAGRTGNGDPRVAFYHDVSADLTAQAMARQRSTSERLATMPSPAAALLANPARYIITTRDRFLPPAVQRRLAAERLDIAAPDEIESGHCPNLSRPELLADRLVACVGTT